MTAGEPSPAGPASIRPVRATDAAAFAAIYNPQILGSVVTFEEEPIDEAEMARRIRAHPVGPRTPWIVLEAGGRVVGYAYARPYHVRSAYRFTVESTIYLDPSATGRGLGGVLYRHLLGQLDAAGVHAVLALISVPNPPSLRLHERCGFVRAGRLVEVGFKFGRWVDVEIWQRPAG